MKHISAANTKTTNWSGGTTTELYIFPEEGDFKSREFFFRISTATVEVETSVFTSLPAIDRSLMVLSGELELIHEDQHVAKLQPFEVDFFKGDWTTKSLGKCIDLNLMCKEGFSGNISAISLREKEDIELFGGEHTIAHLFKGMLSFQNRDVIEKDVLVLEPNQKLSVRAEKESTLILINVSSGEA